MTREEIAQIIVGSSPDEFDPATIGPAGRATWVNALAKADTILQRLASPSGDVGELIGKLQLPGLPPYLADLAGQAASTLRAQAEECLQSMATIARERARADAAEALLREAGEVVEPFAKMGLLIDGPFAPRGDTGDAKPFRSGGAWQEDGKPRTVTFGDFRRASAFSTKLKERIND